MSYYDTAEGKRVLDLENQITTLSANIYAAEYRFACSRNSMSLRVGVAKASKPLRIGSIGSAASA